MSEQTFSVGDLALAAFLATRGATLLRVIRTRTDPPHAECVFLETPALHAIISDYTRNGLVVAHEYAAWGVRLKRLIFEALRHSIARP